MKQRKGKKKVDVPVEEKPKAKKETKPAAKKEAKKSK